MPLPLRCHSIALGLLVFTVPLPGAIRAEWPPANEPASILARFEGIERMNYSPPIYAFEQENVAVTGKGTLDGSADWDTWWAWNDTKKGKPTKQVPAREGLLKQGTEGVPIVNSPMWEIRPVLCTNVTVRGATLRSLGPNNDGCDPESCKDVLIEDCFSETGDDCIAIKSGRNNDGRRINDPSENIVIRRCTMKDGRGGAIEGIRRRNIKIGRVGNAVFAIQFDCEEGAKGDHQPVLRNVGLENVSCESSERPLLVTSIPAAVVEDARIKDSTFRGVQAADLLGHSGSLVLENVAIEPRKAKG